MAARALRVGAADRDGAALPRWLMLALVVGAALLLAACATLSQDQCEAGDWRAIGFRDGAAGRAPAYLANHQDACAQYGIAPDSALYTAGRTEGLRRYCQLANAETEGLAGRRYNGVCPGEVGVSFARVHAAALEIHAREAQIDSLDADISRLIRQLANPELSPEQRAALRAQIQRLHSRQRSLSLQIATRENRLMTVRRAEQVRLNQLGITG